MTLLPITPLKPGRVPRRITLHWTAGGYVPSAEDLKHYHYVIDGDGVLRPGVSVDRNCPVRRAGYAAHTASANSNNIGVALAGMGGADYGEALEGRYGPHPLLLNQFVTAARWVAELCTGHGIVCSPDRVLGHSEWQTRLNVRQRGKWDVGVVPHTDTRYRVLDDGTCVAMNWFRSVVRQMMPSQ